MGGTLPVHDNSVNLARVELPRCRRKAMALFRHAGAVGQSSRTRFTEKRRGVVPAAVARALAQAVKLFLVFLPLMGCSSLKRFIVGSPPEGVPGHVEGFLGGVVADEPRATLVAREVLSSGGNAADAATALGFALAVTLPSRAGLGGGGACLVYRPGMAGPRALLFLPKAGASPALNADRPAAVPMLPIGLETLHARFGHLPLDRLLSPAEELARFGVPVSRALARDLQVVAQPLLADPAARAIFGAGGLVLDEGGVLYQRDLATSLSQLRIAGLADFYHGVLAQRLQTAAAAAGGGLSASDFAKASVQDADALVLSAGAVRIGFLPPPADGGLAAAAAFRVLEQKPDAFAAAKERAIAVAARWRAAGGDANELLSAVLPKASLPPLPASSAFVVLDRSGNAVSCALTMNNLFGTGRVAPGTGILLAASPRVAPLPLLAAAIGWLPENNAFRVTAAASGQDGAPVALADGLLSALRGEEPMPKPLPPEPGRLAIISCPQGLPGDEESCKWVADPRGAGAALGEKSPKEMEQENPQSKGK